MDPVIQQWINNLTHGDTPIHLWPIHVSPTKKILSLEQDSRETLLVYSKDNAYDRYKTYSSCTRLVPRPYTILLNKETFLLEKIPGRLIGDQVYEKLHQDDQHGLTRLIAKTARYTALLHNDLKHCLHLPRPSTWREVLEERCSLALEHANSETREKITRICDRLLQVDAATTTPNYTGHGDLHLYQIIDAGKCIYFLDPGGEPDTKKRPGPEYDLAALIRSIEYVYETISQLHRPRIPLRYGIQRLLASYMEIQGYNPGSLAIGYIARLLYEYYYENHYETGLEWIPGKHLYYVARGQHLWLGFY